MLVKYPFFGSVIASVDYKESKDIPTAETDGRTIYYNPDFLKKVSVEEQTFIFAHEVCHIAFNHIAISKEKNQIYNLSNEKEEITIKELANLMSSMYKDKQISVIYNIPKEQSKGYVSFKSTPLDTSKIEKYGWTPKVKLQEGITKTVQFFENINHY